MHKEPGYAKMPRSRRPRLHFHVIAIPFSKTIITLDDAIHWAKTHFECRGYVEGGEVEGKPGVYAWFFFPDPCYKNQLGHELMVAYDNIKKGLKAKIFFGKGQYHHIVKSNKENHRQETELVDEDLYAEWDGSTPFQVFLYERGSPKDPLMLQFGSFDPELIEPEP